MKFLKIFSAILFFSFLGAVSNQLCAQRDASISQSFKVTDSLVNGVYKADFFIGINRSVNLRIIKDNDINTASLTQIYRLDPSEIFKELHITRREGTGMVCAFILEPDKPLAQLDLSSWFRKRSPRLVFQYVLNDDIDAFDSAHLKLESDGQLVIYSNTGGVPIQLLARPK